MPTKAPRIYVPISPDLMDALDEFTKVSGVAKSQILGQLISEAGPVIRAMTEAYRLAKKSPAQAIEPMRELAQKAHIEVAQHQLALDAATAKKKRKLRKSPKRD